VAHPLAGGTDRGRVRQYGASDETLPLFLATLADYPSRKVDVAAIAIVDRALAPGADVEFAQWTSDGIVLVLDR